MIIEYFSKIYPEKLREIKDPPSRLYVKGNVELLKEFSISVVGSRTNTQYGEKMCKLFVKNLVNYNVNIVSGLALGIDSIAHKTCLEYGGKTIAVLPCGLENIYPKQNIVLSEQIVKNGGLLISEYENNIKADSNKFRQRNRIVAGIGMGTLVVEAGERSGTSITAKDTILQGKPVFAIPSNLDNKKGKTTNRLIQNGSHLVTSVEDILEYYPNINFLKSENSKIKNNLDIPNEFVNLYNSLENGPLDINEICIKTGLDTKEVLYQTMMLEIEDKVLELPNQKFIRKENL